MIIVPGYNNWTRRRTWHSWAGRRDGRDTELSLVTVCRLSCQIVWIVESLYYGIASDERACSVRSRIYRSSSFVNHLDLEVGIGTATPGDNKQMESLLKSRWAIREYHWQWWWKRVWGKVDSLINLCFKFDKFCVKRKNRLLTEGGTGRQLFFQITISKSLSVNNACVGDWYRIKDDFLLLFLALQL